MIMGLLLLFSMVKVKQCFEIGRVTHNEKTGMDYFEKRCCTVYIIFAKVRIASYNTLNRSSK